VVERYIRARVGDSVLDLGCGPADILEHLPAVEYLGIDVSIKYLEEARRRFADRTPRARFIQMDARALHATGERFDLALAQGLLHHFDDEQAYMLLNNVSAMMKPGARLITVDAARTPDQRLIARLLVSSDRGRFVRSPDGYERLARRVFSHVELHVRHDLMRLPYTHLFMECSDPQETAATPT
jgi:ubiquinone/menaquinone biosynthesis C-methylase UbiE